MDDPRMPVLPGGRVRRPDIRGKYFCHHVSFETLTASAIDSRDQFVVGAEGIGFEILKTSVLAQNYGAKVLLELTPQGQKLSNVPMFLSLFGTGRLPQYWSPGIFLPIATTLVVAADDRQLIAGAQNVRIAFHGRKVYRQPVYPRREYRTYFPYSYVANFTADNGGVGALTANGVSILNIPTDGSADFEVRAISIVSDAAITLQVASESDNWFQETMRSELFGGSLVELPTDGGSGEYAFRLPAPRFVPGAEPISVYVTEAGGVANRVQIAFHGNKLYPKGGLAIPEVLVRLERGIEPRSLR